MPTRKKSAVKPLLPVTIEQGGIRYAPGMKAGRWIFATGHKGNADFAGGMSADVMREALPSWDSSKHRRESDQIFANLGRVLQAGGSRFGNIVRVDQYYTDYRAVPPYHGARRAALGDHIPPSTSILMPRLLLAGQDIEMQMIAVEDGVKVQHIRPKAHAIHASSGYSLALTAGDFVFIAGRLADALVLTDGLAPEVRLPAGHLWKGVPVKLETEYTIKQKLEPALKAAGSSLADIVKCQVYLRDPGRFRAVQRSVARILSEETAGDERDIDGHAGARDRGGKDRDQRDCLAQRRQDTRANRRCESHAGVGRLQPGGARGRPPVYFRIAGDRPQRAHRCRTRRSCAAAVRLERAAQMDHMLGNAQKLCEAAGTSLANVVRIQQFHTDLKDFYPAYQVWEQHLPGQYLPYSAVEVPFLPVPGCTVQLDLWVYVP
jgi:enamine deaminase RidA (YjgF/YER057c/UK114 family)